MGKLSMSEERLAGERGYSLVTDDRCGNSKAKVVLVSIISFVVALVIVLLVVVIKVDKKFGNLPGGPDQEPCVDVAIIGAGLAGSYTAWRLRNRQLRVSVYEMTDRTGGRLHTTSFPELPNVKVEFGAPHFNPRQQPYLFELARAINLGLQPSQYSENANNTKYLLRGKLLSFGSSGTSDVPYQLQPNEAKKSPAELLKYYMEQVISPENRSDISLMTTNDGRPLDEQSYISLLRKAASPEGLQFLQAVNPFLEFNGNAALLGHLVDKLEPSSNDSVFTTNTESTSTGPTTDAYTSVTWANSSVLDAFDGFYTFEGGMSQLPETLIEEFLKASLENHMHHSYKLWGFEPGDGSFNLFFNETREEAGTIISIGQKSTVCAKKLVLAIPPEAVEKLHKDWYVKDEEEINHLLQGQHRIPAMHMLLLYNDTLLHDNATSWQHLYTDLPLSRITHVKPIITTESGQAELQNISIVQVLIEGKDVSRFLDAIKEENYCDKDKSASWQNDTSALKNMVTLYLSHALNRTDVPLPSEVLLHDWNEATYGSAWHVWKPCVKWHSVSSLLQPPPYQSIFIVGSAYNASNSHDSMESALHSVDELFKRGLL